MNFDVSKNLGRIKQDIAMACGPAGRNPDEVVIVGVTKYFDYRGIVAAVRGGIGHIGENRPMEVREKFAAADAALDAPLGPGKHYKKYMIGHLQSNKVKVTLELFDMVQSLDSVHLADEINRQAKRMNIEKVECLIELKISEEESKTGIHLASINELVAAVKGMDRLQVLGVMGIPPFMPDPEDARPYFSRLREAYESLKSEQTDHFEMRYLSMGMSHDFRVAVEEGANMVRIGQALFE